jgi:hypothetical protein
MRRSMVLSRGDRGKLEAMSQKEKQQHPPLNKVISAEIILDKMNQIISTSSAALKKSAVTAEFA